MGLKRIELTDFLGSWSLSRQIFDAAGGVTGNLEGEAHFEAHPDNPAALRYRENGTLQLDGVAAVAAQRAYTWKSGPDRGVVEVEFEDGRPFHRIDLNCTMPHDMHLCAPDNYYGSYDFRDWPVWTVGWRVQGPRKDYRMLTQYRRPIAAQNP